MAHRFYILFYRTNVAVWQVPCCFSKPHFGCFGLFWELIVLNYFLRRKYNYFHKCHWLIYSTTLSLPMLHLLSRLPILLNFDKEPPLLLPLASHGERQELQIGEGGMQPLVEWEKGVECHLLIIGCSKYNHAILRRCQFNLP